ncbi:GspH/FimT family pseudopilin [Simplicispira suum]|uniref:Type II secretion system protein H n=1 Tax=Simplicispira suum TaxID=2109915 RepID=A0A2S0N1W2_9BURK|nr:GspH/FimT family pseudopilin [Simplicispira suum]AVO42116.1 general secretion pathway protein GspH [Simplicispira suum]
MPLCPYLRNSVAARNRPHEQGFTAIELMVVVAIVAILAALAGPSFRDLIDGWRVRSAVEEITSTIYYARSEAIKRGGRVSVRKNCGVGTAQEWKCGWIVFTDTNENGVLNTGGANPDVILQTYSAQQGVNVNHLRNSAFFTLNRWGQINGLGAASFSFTPEGLGSSSRHASALCVTSGGRIKTTKDTVSCP